MSSPPFARHGLAVAALILGSALVGPASAQSRDRVEYAEAPDSQEGFRILEQRRRDTSHPGDPLNLVGVFEGDNDLRVGKGSLTRSTYKPAFVDRDEAYERQLAMLEDRTWVAQAGSPARNSGPYRPGEAVPRKGRGQVETTGSDPEDAGSSRGAWTLSLLAAAAAVGALMIQGRRMGA